MPKALFAILPPLLLSGCGTCMSLQTQPTPYGGVALDARFISNLYPSRIKDLEGDSQGWAHLFGVISIFDLPLSAAADTLLLPLTVPPAIEKARSASARAEE